MSGWPTAKLCEVAQIERNGIASEAIETGTKYLGLEHIESGGKILGFADVDAGELASTKFQFTSDHVLYGKLRPYLAKIALPDFDGICSTDIVPIKPKSRLDKRYLAYFLRQPEMVAFANSRAAGANLPRLSPKALADFEIPLPPLEEQKRIATILDQADDIRRKRQHAIERLNQLGQAIFHEMFGDPIAPDANNSERLDDVAELINGDRSSNYPSGEDIKDSGVLFLNTTNIKNGEIELTKSQYISNEKFSSLTRGKLNRNDLVITLRGTLGQCALFDCRFETGFINAQMMIIRCHKNIMPRYLKEYISFPSMQKKLNSANTGSAVPQLTAAQMKEMRIIVPSLEEQNAFVSAINSARAFYEVQNKHISELTKLFASLQHCAFTGQL